MGLYILKTVSLARKDAIRLGMLLSFEVGGQVDEESIIPLLL
jgi:hypothetical protein